MVLDHYAGGVHIAFPLSAHVVADEAQGEHVFDGINDIYAIGAVEENAHRASISFFYLENDLPAGAAGRDGFLQQHAVNVLCGYGDVCDGEFRMLCLCGEDGGTLGAQACGEGGVLLVGADCHAPVFKPDASADTEV